MKQVIELKRKLGNYEYFMSQFAQPGTEKILFVNPSLSGKYLYKMILPHLIETPGVATAVTGLSDYSVEEQLVGYKSLDILSREATCEDQTTMIRWATRIIFPFVAQPLHDIYNHIRSINPHCKVEFCIDFNCWELPDGHQLKSMFDEDIVLPIITDNMYFSDAILVSNEAMRQYLVNLLSNLVRTTYLGVNREAVNEMIEINNQAFWTSEKVVFGNVDYDPKDIIFKVPVPQIVEEVPPIVENNPLKDDKKDVKLSNKTPTTKPTAVIKKTGAKPVSKNKGKNVIKKAVKKVPLDKKGKKKK